MQQEPPTYEVDRCPAECDNKLPNQNKPDETYIFVLDANINNALGKERQCEL